MLNLSKLTTHDMKSLLKLTVMLWIQSSLSGRNNVAHAALCKEELSAAINKFGIDMYMELSASHPNENVFFSPISITTALSMLMLGAKGKTKSQMEDVLYTTGLKKCLHDTYQFFDKNLYGGVGGPILESANKLYPDQTLVVNGRFKRDIAKYYNATVEGLDYRDAAASRAIINAWVSKQTNTMIPSVLHPSSINSITVMVLINAIYFKGNWLNKFDISDTSVESFTTESGGKINVNMMYQEDLFNHYYDNDLKAQFLELPYVVGKNDGSVDIRMVIILPDAKDAINDLQNKLTHEKLAKAL
ncbi:unnamed protein product, partial [Owenia fusiformis]